MITKAGTQLKKIYYFIAENKNAFIITGVVFSILLMYVRAFFGTELSDEAYYVSEAKTILEGNVPFVYATGTKAEGFTFLLVAVERLYQFFVPDLTGVFLFTRLCFVTFKMIVWAVVFFVFKRKNRLSTALLTSALLIPLNGPILNFNYNTVPELTMFMVGCILFDVIEQDAPRKELRLVLSGILTGIACFANPGFGVALIVFFIIIAIRVKDKIQKIKALLYYAIAILADVIVVVFSLSAASSFSELCYGFYRLYINPLPADALDTKTPWTRTIASFTQPILQWILILIPVSLLAYYLASKYPKKTETHNHEQRVLFAISVSFFVHSFFILLSNPRHLSSAGGGEIRAFTTFCYMVLLIIAHAYKNNSIVWYLGLFQPIYAIVEILTVNSDATIYRFINVFTIIVPVIYILLVSQSKMIRRIAGVLAVAIILTQLFANYILIYRDYGVNTIRHHQVQSGVYKGLFTTEQRAKHLPELEAYLNSVIDDDDIYAFRDNVPFAYLMVHKGEPCEKTTWDILQYHHHRNSPVLLFDYYRVRDMIPDKIIYIDFGKDERLSIFDDNYRYNDWVNAYYELVEDVKVNDTFFRVMVFQYNGKFDGNYQYWIDNYWGSVK